jgi:phytoene synthase
MTHPLLSVGDAALAASDADYCASIVRKHARTFTLASRFLPAEKRRSAYALYAFCRVADDIVDRPRPVGSSAAVELAWFRQSVERALAGAPEGPVLRELVRTVKKFNVPREVLDELLNGVARDLVPTRYATWEELSAYCEGVAASVGAMCTYVFGVPGDASVRAQALQYARTLGVAMQLTNILRDVGEDAANGRCYLPADVLSQFGLSADRVLSDPTLRDDPRWVSLMRHEIARARELYRAAAPGIALLSADAQRCARACADGYAEILGAIERNGYDSITVRARVGGWRKAGLLLRLLSA